MRVRPARSSGRAVGTLVALLGLAGAGARPAAAHVGSPDTWFEGAAGPYPIRVVVRAPGVVPGLAEIDVRVLDGAPRRVTVQPFAWNAGAGGAPPADVTKPVPGDARLFTVNLWFMAATSYGVHVVVTGDRGEGVAIVPVQAVATRRLPMERGLVGVLLALAAFLFAGLVTIVGAATRDSTVPPGEEPDARRTGGARVAMAVSAVALAVALLGGRRWWNQVDRAYAADLYRPFHATAAIVDSAGAPWVRLTIDDPRWRGRTWSPLIPDHGKLMHLFLVSEPEPDVIAHLHPVPTDSTTFVARLPALPASDYRVFADIVHESGFAQTLIAQVALPAPPPAPDVAVPSDPDDAWFAGAATPDSAAAERRFTLPDGATLVWRRGARPIELGAERVLRFRVIEPGGAPGALDPTWG